jgi:hypothetical protein
VTPLPLRCVVDTNVCTTANRVNNGASMDCVVNSGRALQAVMERGHVFIDDKLRIVGEYRRNLNAKGQPGPGDMFFKWLLTHEWGGERVTKVTITPKDGDPEDFVELPAPKDGTTYDPSDRKFLAVAASCDEKPPILQSFDSKWWGWQSALREIGVTIHFLCVGDIQEKHKKKMGP